MIAPDGLLSPSRLLFEIIPGHMLLDECQKVLKITVLVRLGRLYDVPPLTTNLSNYQCVSCTSVDTLRTHGGMCCTEHLACHTFDAMQVHRASESPSGSCQAIVPLCD